MFLLLLPLLLWCSRHVLAVPESSVMSSAPEVSVVANTTLYATNTYTFTVTSVRTVTSSIDSSINGSTTSSSLSTPTCSQITHYSYTALIAVKKDAPFHLKPLTAAGLSFYVGSYIEPASYCPDIVKQYGAICPAGNVTALWGCSMAVEVPGGQSIYLDPSGALKYTQAHSAYIPVGSIQCPLIWNDPSVQGLSCVTVNSWLSDGLMACPMAQNTTMYTEDEYQVFVNGPNVTVPNGDPGSCIPFETLAVNVESDSQFGAWQYT